MATFFCSAKLSSFDLSKLDADGIFLVRSVEKNRSISQSRSKIASLDEDFSELVGFSAAFWYLLVVVVMALLFLFIHSILFVVGHRYIWTILLSQVSVCRRTI